MQGGAMEINPQIGPLSDGSLPAAATPRFKPCSCCPFNPKDWPQSDAEVKILPCMTTCPYCGMKCSQAWRLRKHIKKSALHKPQHLTVEGTKVTSLHRATYDASVGRFKPCECCVIRPGDWPESNAEVVTRPCMKACPYCGRIFAGTQQLRHHITLSQSHRYQRLTAKAGGYSGRKRLPTTGPPTGTYEFSIYENFGSNDSGTTEPVLSGLSSAAAQNYAHHTGNQRYDMNQGRIPSFFSNDGHSNTYRSPYASSFSAVGQNGAQDAANQKAPVNYAFPRNNGHSNTYISPYASSFSAVVQNGAQDAANQKAPVDHASPRPDHQVSDPESPLSEHSSWSNLSQEGNDSIAKTLTGSRVGHSSQSNFISDDHMKIAEALPVSRSTATTQNDIRDCGSQTFPGDLPQPDSHKGIPAYAAEAFRNTIKSNLAALCSDIIETARSDLPRARRDLGELKEITNQYFSAAESAFDSIHD
ncbi:hypothetical protein V492_01685 [Pseudogymnoascus sp. VKM F-4246]|nr:hypothetical protein V492_01685 [Pseudogymnoascus sp. VKM F-4246]